MGIIVKTIVAFCLGLGALTAVQHYWMSAITARIAAVPHTPMMSHVQQKMPAFTLDADKLSQAINPGLGRLDTKEGQRLAVEGAARRIDMQTRNALSHVPVQRSYPGVPRY